MTEGKTIEKEVDIREDPRRISFVWHVDEYTRVVVIDGRIGEREKRIY